MNSEIAHLRMYLHSFQKSNIFSLVEKQHCANGQRTNIWFFKSCVIRKSVVGNAPDKKG